MCNVTHKVTNETKPGKDFVTNDNAVRSISPFITGTNENQYKFYEIWQYIYKVLKMFFDMIILILGIYPKEIIKDLINFRSVFL